jgi:hypothetical protein
MGKSAARYSFSSLEDESRVVNVGKPLLTAPEILGSIVSLPFAIAEALYMSIYYWETLPNLVGASCLSPVLGSHKVDIEVSAGV